MRDRRVARVFLCAGVAALFVIAVLVAAAGEKVAVLSGKAAMGDWTSDAPGVTRNITVQVYAWGIRNAVGIAFRPGTNELWMSTNERDEIGEDLPPDYISSVRPGGFYGWPWYYIGNHQDPRHKGKHPELADKVIVPDVLVEAHSASLNLCFYTGGQFPSEYKGDIFAAFHGSWNRMKRTGYKVVRVLLDKATGKAHGEYEDFVTGFVTPDGKVWGRPVGITVAKDGSLLISEDGDKTIWRVSYK
jgi:glucose/arabinose dehydrogenase